MSHRYSVKKTTLVVSLSLLVGLLFVSSLSTGSRDHSDKNPRFIKDHSPIHTQKLSNPISVKIHKVGNQEFVPGVPLQLIGSVITQQNTSQLDMVWNTSKRVHVTSGSKNVTISNVQAGKTYTVSLTVLTNNSENEQIHLRAGMSLGALRFSHSTMYNTTLEKAISDSKKALSERTKAFSGQ